MVKCITMLMVFCCGFICKKDMNKKVDGRATIKKNLILCKKNGLEQASCGVYLKNIKKVTNKYTIYEK
ncbi:hypothetical protein BC670_3394 [Flavobacterium branchiophilum]|uniref:Uncharacterized protein n=1 Tax=Flavobacterium branchiophilum TaxID=55197 RepID=A0A543G8D1_9FLAO|nr:hypothetical protein BC670_3394 [Flavobacterium branchiophilum]